MNDHDLSLLTDEEREAVKWTENTGDGPLARGAQLFLRSLIAARAEIGRLREMLPWYVRERRENRRLRHNIGMFAADMDTADNLMDEGRDAEAVDVLENVRHGLRALLQSEKGGE